MHRTALPHILSPIPRSHLAGHAFHVLNHGNGGATVFHGDGDYRAFLELLAAAKAKHPVKILAFCLMPNHFHLVLQPIRDASLSPFMHWRYLQLIAPLSASHAAEIPYGLGAPVLDDDLTILRTCVNHQQPFGSPPVATPHRSPARTGFHVAPPRPSTTSPA